MKAKIKGYKKPINLSRIATRKNLSIEVEAGYFVAYADCIYDLTYLQGLILLRLMGCSEENSTAIMKSMYFNSHTSYYLHW